MGRAKLNMELISKEKTRNVTYQKRKSGLLKKAYEFTTLCDVDTCLIIYGPNSSEPETWPTNPDDVKRIISIYKDKRSDSGKRTFDLSDFFEDRKKKIEEELAKARRRNMEAKYPTWFDFLNNLNEVQLREFANVLDNKLEASKARVELMKGNNDYFQGMPGLPLDYLENADYVPRLPLGLSTQYGLSLENKIDDHFNMPIMNYPPLDQGHLTCQINPNPMMMLMMSDNGYGHHHDQYNDGASCSNVEYAAAPFNGEVCYDAVCGMIESTHHVVYNNPNSIPLMRYYVEPATTLQPLPLQPQFMQCAALMSSQVHGSQGNEYDDGGEDYQMNNKRGRIN